MTARRLFQALLTGFLFCFPGGLRGFEFVILKYKGGDYYNARAGVENFLGELRKRTTVETSPKPPELSLDDEAVFRRVFLFLNGHLPVSFSPAERANLRKFIEGGGFLFANDDYGMDESFRREMRDIFPEYPLREIPFDHAVYRILYSFPQGIPKVHEHDGGRARAYGIFIRGRLAVFYAFNTDIADGWDFAEVHNNPQETREAAIRMGVNIVLYALSH